METWDKRAGCRRLVRTGRMRLAAPIAKVFPLLCPVREYDWIDGWDCELLCSESGLVEPGCVFVTNFPGEGRETWITTRRDPDGRFLQFARFVPEERALIYDIALAEADGGCELVWTKTAMVFGDAGRAWAEGYGQASHDAQIAVLENMLNHYLATGEKLPREKALG